MKAYLKQIRISPKKANLVAALVRNKEVKEAVEMLKFTNKKTAPILQKLIESAAANAENNFQQNKDDLYIKEIIVTQGPTYKRGVPVSRGRVHPILKRTSHITIKLALKEEAKATTTKTAKPEKKDTTSPKKEKPAKKSETKKKTESKKTTKNKKE